MGNFEVMKRKQLEEWLEAHDFSVLLADGFDEAFLGVETSDDIHRAVYSIEKCISLLCRTMMEDDAKDYFYFNTMGSYVGEHTPIFIHTPRTH